VTGVQTCALPIYNQSKAIELAQNERLIVGYKKARAIRDAKNRKRGLEKLEKAIQTGKLGKKHINNRGYNKYLQIEGDVNIKINYNKFEEYAKWDGLKGTPPTPNYQKKKLSHNTANCGRLKRHSEYLNPTYKSAQFITDYAEE